MSAVQYASEHLAALAAAPEHAADVQQAMATLAFDKVSRPRGDVCVEGG
jgi:hypothetical protein